MKLMILVSRGITTFMDSLLIDCGYLESPEEVTQTSVDNYPIGQ
jgi:hypothetical protein